MKIKVNENKVSKKKLLFVAALAGIGLTYGTLAYFQTHDTFKNNFEVAKYIPSISEDFESPDNWKPGETVPKRVTVENKGTIPIIARVSYDEYWRNKKDETLPMVDKNGNKVAIINFNDDGNWILKDGYYYYHAEIQPGETSTSFIESVTFNPDYVITGIERVEEDTDEDSNGKNDTKTVTYEAGDESHLGGKYHLNINVETIQADQAKNVWGVDINKLQNETAASLFTYTITYNNQVIITGYDVERGGTDVVIPEKIEGLPVTIIRNNAFENNQLTSVKIPTSVTSIESSAFKNNQLTSVEIPSSVKTIGALSFSDNQLTSVILHEGLNTIESNAFNNNQLTSVEIPNSVSNIYAAAFQNNQLTSVVIPSGLKTISNSVFKNNQLTSVEIPTSVTSIGQSTFENNQITKVILNEGLESMGNMAFYKNKITEVEIPSTVTNMGIMVFQDNQISKVTLHEGLKEIPLNTFNKNQITEVTIPSTVTTIGDAAFYQNMLTFIEIPGSVKTIGVNAFNKNQITKVILNEGLESIDKQAFSNFKTPTDTISNKITEVEIPSTVTNLADDAFSSGVVITRK